MDLKVTRDFQIDIIGDDNGYDFTTDVWDSNARVRPG